MLPADDAPDPDDRADLLRVGVDDRPDGAVVVSVCGEVDLHTSGLLSEALEGVLATGPSAIVIDMTAVDFLSSSGLSALVELLRAIGTRTIPVRLVSGGRAVTRPMQAAGLEDMFSWHDSVGEALGEQLG